MLSLLVRYKNLRMIGGRMIDLKSYSFFSNNLSNLKELSLDKQNGQKNYMIQDKREAVNFDAVKAEYIKFLKLTTIPRSNDALFDDGKGSLVFVEFKNGCIDNRIVFEIKQKIYDSILIFSDITAKGISYTRSHMNYILVYNEDKIKDNLYNEDVNNTSNVAVQRSSSFDDFAKKVGQYAKEEYIKFGLKRFQNYCFKEVHTYTKKEFQDYLLNL